MTTEAGLIATVGMFDGVHRGHKALLARLKAEGESRGLKPAVFTFERHPLTIIAPDRAPRSLMGAADKKMALHACGIENVVVFNFDDTMRRLTAEEFLTMLRDNYGVKALLMGFNHLFGSDRLSEFEQYEAIGRKLGVEIVRAAELRDDGHESSPTICSSTIRQLLEAGDVAKASAILGYPYAIEGTVVDGKKLGRTIGYPTANIVVSDGTRIVPRSGVYAADVVIADGSIHRAMLNIGRRPTVDKSVAPETTIEAHLIGWHGDLYGQRLRIEFLQRIRDERRFDSLEALQHQLDCDRDASLSLPSTPGQIKK